MSLDEILHNLYHQTFAFIDETEVITQAKSDIKKLIVGEIRKLDEFGEAPEDYQEALDDCITKIEGL